MEALIVKKGDRYGRLTIISEAPNLNQYRKFFVECDCGTGKVVPLASMRSGKTKSCGCLNRENQPMNTLKHGHGSRVKGASVTYITWASMLARCRNPKDRSYRHYGGRGITVCERWYVFENFLQDMGERPAGLSIDRIDNDKGYSPENCRWANAFQQVNNRRNTKRFTYKGKTQGLSEWAREIGIDRKTLESRIKSGIELPELFERKHGNTH